MLLSTEVDDGSIIDDLRYTVRTHPNSMSLSFCLWKKGGVFSRDAFR